VSTFDVIRAWKDEEYRSSLNADELARMPAHPSGLVELTDEELVAAQGATWVITSCPCLSIAVSAATSCTPSCNATIWDGTCNVASIGCCDPT
jgi:mersacidin/lichenicidin family type 2 lantibiotic